VPSQNGSPVGSRQAPNRAEWDPQIGQGNSDGVLCPIGRDFPYNQTNGPSGEIFKHLIW
jgi:hypothetical protein